MGCGASSHEHAAHAVQAPKETAGETTAKNEVEGAGTWATKTSLSAPSKDGDSEIFKSPKGFSSPTGGSLLVSKQEKTAVMLLDADSEDEADDGVEIICEAQPKYQARPQPAAANGQEPPEAAEEPRRAEPKPLPKQQQEEAAKLAETRKRFDATRYQNQKRTSDPAILSDVPGAIDTGLDIQLPPTGPTGPLASSDIPRKGPSPVLGRGPSPVRDLVAFTPDDAVAMLSLNVTETTRKDPAMDFGGCLPGGIWDDIEEVSLPMKDTKNREQQHYEVKSNGFDDEDEMMMMEILQNCDA